MKRLLAAVSVAALFAAASPAFAEEARGTVKSVDAAERTLILEDGTEFMLSEGINIDSLMEGDEVSVSYEESDGQKTATEVKPAE